MYTNAYVHGEKLLRSEPMTALFKIRIFWNGILCGGYQHSLGIRWPFPVPLYVGHFRKVCKSQL